MKKICPFLIEFKDIHYFDVSKVIFKCTLGNVLLKTSDLKEKWACGGCPIPSIMNNRLCNYLKPHKTFFLRGSSKTWFSCELLNIIMENTEEFCHLNCKINDQNAIK